MNNIEKLFIPYEEAFDMKSLGFNKPCFGYFYTLDGKKWKFIEKDEYNILDEELNIGNQNTILAPLYSQCFSWFREKYNLTAVIEIGTQEFSYNIFNKEGNTVIGTNRFNYNGTYEQTELEVLKQLIKIIKNENT